MDSKFLCQQSQTKYNVDFSECDLATEIGCLNNGFEGPCISKTKLMTFGDAMCPSNENNESPFRKIIHFRSVLLSMIYGGLILFMEFFIHFLVCIINPSCVLAFYYIFAVFCWSAFYFVLTCVSSRSEIVLLPANESWKSCYPFILKVEKRC